MQRSRSEVERRRRATSLSSRKRYTEHTRVKPSCCGWDEDDEGRCCLCRCRGAQLPGWLRWHAALLGTEAALAAMLLIVTAGRTFCEALPDTWPDSDAGHTACANECPADCFVMSAACQALVALAVLFRVVVAALEAQAVRRRLWLSLRAVRALYALSALSWPPLVAWLWLCVDTATMFRFSRTLEFVLATALSVLSAVHLFELAAVTHTARVQGEHLRIEATMSERQRRGSVSVAEPELAFEALLQS